MSIRLQVTIDNVRIPFWHFRLRYDYVRTT